MDGVQISGDITLSINAIEHEFPKYAQAALYAGAAVLKEETKKNLVTRLPAATNINPKYNDTLLDAVRNTRTTGDEVTIHILGGRQSGGGSFRTRFFENGTKERFQTKRNGKQLKKRKSVGKLKPLHFFSDAISTSETRAVQAMETIVNKFLEKYK